MIYLYFVCNRTEDGIVIAGILLIHSNYHNLVLTITDLYPALPFISKMSHHSPMPGDVGTVSSEEIKESASTVTSENDFSVSDSEQVSTHKLGTAMEPSRTALRCRIGLAIIGITLGCLVFLVFLAVEKFRNYHIACWGLVSGELENVLKSLMFVPLF